MKNEYVIGVLGGMGTYATINLFKQYASVFPAEKEWDRPRIIIDNRCTMPSRVRAYLYKENIPQLVNEMADSISGLIKIGGAKRLILACNTSHLFLPNIYEKIPEAKNRVISIIDECVIRVAEDEVKKVYLLGSEGSIDSGIYQKALKKFGIECVAPQKEEYILLRECIEAVKQNKYSDEIEALFKKLMYKYELPYILGCTELPILYERYLVNSGIKVYDPLLITLKKLKEEFDNE